jgi:hypothetical protein
VFSFTPPSLYPQGKSPWYPLDRRLCGFQIRSGRGGEEKNSQPLPGIEPPIRSFFLTEITPSYLHLRGRKWREGGENSIISGFISCTLHQICDEIKIDEMDGNVTRMGDMRNAYILLGKPERKRSL